MKFYIGNVEYTIKEVEQKEFNQIEEDDGYYFGQSHFFTQEIWLDKSLNESRKRKALYHELMHCYLKECITTQELTNFNEELLCDISANAHDFIQEIAEQYFKRIRIEELLENER